ncbi:MAG: crotonobetainyl-CoA:carnitine CoA-transferase CaiB-like acyl-CoA transferase [Gammaproteobacteria bacterium]|jgi:crotonobetainyl-CoA:carnitine CoA-transferase CaiB-like acyl-CoA transferase
MSVAPLKGVRVLDLTSIVVGPVATQFLGDYGADVVKVEPPSGDLLRRLGGQSKSGSLSPKFMNLNRNKRSLAIDMKGPGADAVMGKLLATSDVVVTNMRPGALKRLGLDYETAKLKRPGIIYCHVVGFGSEGRYAGKPAYDTIIQGMSGVAATNYRAHGEPRYLPMVMADHIVGFVLIQFVLMALLHRHQSGEGQYIEIPMFENMASFVLAEHMGQRVHVDCDGPTGDLRVLDPLHQPIKTRDGHICVSANSDKQAFALFEAIGQPELRQDPRFSSVKARFHNVSEYNKIRNQGLLNKTTAEWVELFDTLDVPAMPFNTFENLLDDPHLADVSLIEEVEHPIEGRIRNVRLPTKTTAEWDEPVRLAPSIGQDSMAILTDLGFAEDTIKELIDSGVLLQGSTERAEPVE